MISIKSVVPIFSLLCLSNSLSAQLKSVFKASVASGCSPLSVSFINNSTGVSNAAIYKWDFGNKNKVTTTKKDSAVGAIYNIDSNYTVTLTITDGGTVSTSSTVITVFKKPIASFTIDKYGGCSPLGVNFISTSTAGSGNISYYLWDFGDGNVLQGDSIAAVANTFKYGGNYPVKLLVRNTNQCSSVQTVNDSLVKVLQSPVASYVKDNNFLCSVGDTAKFKNKTTYTISPTYLWNFGDGTTSIQAAPFHKYLSKGVFQDTLIVTNNNHCADTSIAPSPEYVANFTSNYTGPDSACATSNVTFTNVSSPVPSSFYWESSDINGNVNAATYLRTFKKVGIYDITLVNTFGACIDSIVKPMKVILSSALDGFSINNVPLCNGTVSVFLSDTASGDKDWLWSQTNTNIYQRATIGDFILPADSVYQFSLKATTPSGCVAEVSLIDSIKKNPVEIRYLSNTTPNSLKGCPGLEFQFWPSPSVGIKDLQWDFGDTNYSTSDTPTHTYNNIGIYIVKLVYSTPDGCRDSVLLKSVQTSLKPNAAFSINLNSDTICGNTRIYFHDQSMPKPITTWTWNFGDSTPIDHSQNPKHAYHDTGTFDIQFIAANGACADTLTLPKHFTVIPSIAYVDTIKYTCNGNRDTVTFLQKNTLVTSGYWYFGDGDSMALDTSKRSIKHVYQQEGAYLAVLQSTGGNCIVRDTSNVNVLHRQNPFLVADTNRIISGTNEFCGQDSLIARLNNMDINTAVTNNVYYTLSNWQYGDGSIYSGVPKKTRNFTTGYTETLSPLAAGKMNIRAITISGFFGCFDTSNYVKVKIKGPIAGYKIINPSDCFKTPVTFKDTSKITFGMPIIKWTWGFGDSTSNAVTTNISQIHKYATPDSFATYLKVTDKEGCTDSTRVPMYAMPTGPKASFSWLPVDITTDTISTFTSTSDTFGCVNTKYKWLFSISKLTASSSEVQFTYPSPVTDKITLIVTNPANGCKDTATNSITIKRAFALFSTKVSYSGITTDCPPALVTVTSTSIGATQIRWSFGDNTPGTGLLTTSIVGHTYNKPGRYTIKLYAYNNNTLSDSAFQTVTIKGPFATMRSNVKRSCGPTIVGLTATQENIGKIAWDFGDGNVTFPTKNDTFKAHLYDLAGKYIPTILLEDSLGCKSSFALQDSIIIDTLKASFAVNKTISCDTGLFVFTPTIKSYSGDSLQWLEKIHWSFGTSSNTDTSNALAASFFYNKPGKFAVTQQVSTLAGCKVTNVDTIFINASAKAAIKVPKDVCENDAVLLTATTPNSIGVGWKWFVNNADSSSLQNPNPMYFKTVKDSSYNVLVKLATLRNGCSDTARASFTVHPIPYFSLGINPKKDPVCQNEIITLSAADANTYIWSINNNNTNTHSATFADKPQQTTFYTVTATTQYNCSAKGTATVTIAQPQLPSYPSIKFLCLGDSIELPVYGTDSLLWVYDINSLSNLGNHPFAKPTSTTVYKFLTNDKYNCFPYFGTIDVEVGNYPIPKSETVNIFAGDVVKLSSLSSPHFVTYKWVPTTYLDCSNCAEPSCAPIADIGYAVLVSNKYGCSTTDSLFIHVTCGEAVYIPSAFAPHGVSKLFYPVGRGVRKVVYFRIFNRLGELLFEQRIFNLGNSSFGWDGKVNGKEVDAGTYVYDLEAICDTGEIFHKKGTVVVIK